MCGALNYNASGNWQIEHQCPQCGAPVVLDEADRLLICPYCKTKLFLVTEDHFRYCIQTKDSPPGETIYVPYWRLKGSSFSILINEVTNRFFDANRLALNFSGIPASLGLRPQVFKLRFASPRVEGIFLKPGLSAQTIIQQISGAEYPSNLHQAFIGETVSLIYSPMYRENDILYDSILKRPVYTLKPGEIDGLLASGRQQDWDIAFVSTLCPQCGWDLEGGKDTLVLTCRNCDSAWTCKGTTFEKVAFSVMANVEPDTYYLPFWRMKTRIEGITLQSYADLIRLGNLPKVISYTFEEKELYFWSPAFKVNPSLFLRWSRQLTTFQPGGEAIEKLPVRSIYPVTLPISEAIKSIIITMASIITDKRKFLAILPEIRISLEESQLVYHPFVLSHNELVHAKTGLSIDRNALNFGMFL